MIKLDEEIEINLKNLKDLFGFNSLEEYSNS